jgi:hypothetical protein
MSELENLIRQIVREEIELYFNRHQKNIDKESTGTLKKSAVREDEIDFDLFERKYQEALKIDDQVNEKYKAQAEQFGAVISLKIASEILNMSMNSVKKLAKTDKNFPAIVKGKLTTARLFHWIDGGIAYWNLDDDN